MQMGAPPFFYSPLKECPYHNWYLPLKGLQLLYAFLKLVWSSQTRKIVKNISIIDQFQTSQMSAPLVRFNPSHFSMVYVYSYLLNIHQGNDCF